MTKVINATGDGACLFNAVAIGLAIEILSGRLDDQKDSPGYLKLLDEFAKHHPNFQPKNWDTLKQWLTFYNNSRDIELILAPVLFKLNQKNMNWDIIIVNELTEILFHNSKDINDGRVRGWHSLKNEGYPAWPQIDILPINYRTQLLNTLKGYEGGIERSEIRLYLNLQKKELLADLKNAILSNPDGFKQGFSCDNLKKMTDSLNISLVENSVITPSAITNKIYLHNEEQHWDVQCNENDYDSFIDAKPRTLQITSDEAYNGIIAVAAPPINPLVSKPQESVVINQDKKVEIGTKTAEKKQTPVLVIPEIMKEQSKITAEQIEELISTRKTFDETAEGLDSWLRANAETIFNIMTHINIEINWEKVSAKELCNLMGIEHKTVSTQPKVVQEVNLPTPLPQRKEKVTSIKKHLDILAGKITELETDHYTAAATAAQAIYDKVNTLVQQFEIGTIDDQKLKADSKSILDKNRGELEEFRGWKLKKVGEVLVNLLAVIFSCSISYFATGQFSIFKVQTDSAEKINILEESINITPK